MQIMICAIGKIKPGPETALIDKYVKQTKWPVVIKEFEDKKAGTDDEHKKREGEMLLSAIPSGAKIVALDERGKIMSSPDFAKIMGKWESEGVSTVAFLIGGAFGHNDETRKKANMLLAFGQMTWPHFLARAMLTEQIYRAKSILDGHPYHKI
ncbi:MAG: 23S rRNA (pseudouridine(1915)-N(3))-methyltransferase RlmH [Alphaproteobacteria bacterium]|nr:23S rRNA (pseudouridine(1915)-N(3))-methyltransferase RlmH [Alphaproteobacteria bacterium]